MKKTISLILTMFLLLLTVTGCSKGRKLVNPVNPPVDSELEITTQSVSKTKSGEKIGETKIDYWEWAVWRAKIVAYTAVAVISGYFVFQLAEGINNFKREGE
jgi:hypothetical protein